MFVLIYKMNAGNIKRYSRWQCYFDDLKRNASVIHIASDNNFPIGDFSVTDNPDDFKITNYVYMQSIRTTSYEKRQQLGLKNITESILRRPEISIVGTKLHMLPEYYLRRYGVSVTLVDDTLHYRCAHVYKVVLK